MGRHLNLRAQKGLVKLGDVVMGPADQAHWPKFGRSDFPQHIDRMLNYMTVEDREGIKFLLPVLSFTPNFGIKWILNLAEKHHFFPGKLGDILRQLRLGLKGLIFTLYYSNIDDSKEEGKKIYQTLKWDAQMPSYKEGAPLSAQEIREISQIARLEIQNTSLDERLRLIASLKDVVLKHRHRIMDRIQAETKKARLDALSSEIFPLLDHLDFLEKNAKKILKDKKVKTPLAMMGKSSMVHYGPLGTVLVISPWNYPFYQAIVPISTAIICGNSVIYKPSEITPLKGLVEEILELSGIPATWAQICYGDGQLGAKLIETRPDKIFFTGSVATGKKIMQEASKHLIPVELELGGKDPMIVFDDVNVERAVAGALWGGMTNSGQSCTSVEKLFVHESIYDKFKARLIEKADEIKMGFDREGESDMGDITSPLQVKIIKEQLEALKANQGQVLNKRLWDSSSSRIAPMIIEASDSDLISNEETFGPILCLYKFSHESEVIARANDSKYGLSASVWSADKKRCLRVACALECGNVSINNVMLTEGNHHLPFGGMKNSGFGRYKGRWGLESFSNIKSILVDSNGPKIEANWYPYGKEKTKLFDAMMEGLYGRGLKSFFQFAINGIKLESLAAKLWKKGR